jgi:diguanylate cyclase (GGDEF)-like protein
VTSPDSLLASVAHLVVEGGQVIAVGAEVATELECDPATLHGPLDEIGTRLDDVTFAQLLSGESTLRVRLGSGLADRPVRLRRLGAEGDRVWLEIRSLASEFRLESLLRRSGYGHMLLSPAIELLWSLSSNELSDVFPGDNPLHWVELMDPDDMQVLGKAIFEVGADTSLSRTVRHRLNADRTYTIVDQVESAIHDPDLRAVLVRSRLDDTWTGSAHDDSSSATYAGVTVSDHMPIGVVVASTAGKVLHRNAVAAELVGARDGQAITAADGDSWLFDGLDHDHAQAYLAVIDQATGGRSAHCTVPAPLHPARWLRVSASPAAASTLVMTIEDMTELSEAEREVRASHRLLEALDSHSEELVVVLDAEGQARYTSSSIRRHLGEGANVRSFGDVVRYVHAPDRPLLLDLEQRVRSLPAGSGAVDLRVDVDETSGGRWHHAALTNLLDDPDVGGLVLTLRDVHERQLVERELRFWATHDALTTLPDRSALRTQLDAVLHEAAILGRRTALVFCDVDHFKQINDEAGHQVGDLVLTEVAARLRASLRGSDVVGRFGGDEFVVVVPNVDDEVHALMLAERVFATVSGPATIDGVDLPISISMGVAITDEHCTTAEELLRRADLAMYRSKRAGRGRLTLHRDEASDGAATVDGDGAA